MLDYHHVHIHKNFELELLLVNKLPEEELTNLIGEKYQSFAN